MWPDHALAQARPARGHALAPSIGSQPAPSCLKNMAGSASFGWIESIEMPPPVVLVPHNSSNGARVESPSPTLKERQRLEAERESDRRFFEDPPDDYVRCPNCSVVYAIHTSRPTTPSDPQTREFAAKTPPTPLIPASYSKELARGANLSLEDTLRHMHISRFRCQQCDADFCRCGVSPYHWGWSCEGWQKHLQMDPSSSVGTCRWCNQPCMNKMRRSECLVTACCGNDDGTDLKRFPPSLSCAEKELRGCGKRHPCGHWCGGVRGELQCLPCLQGDCRKKSSSSSVPPSTCSTLPDGEEWCSICWTEPLSAAPSVQLDCGHVFHHHCVEAMINRARPGGKRLTFKSVRCPLCQAFCQHPSIDALIAPHIALYNKVRRKALQRWVVEQRKPTPKAGDPADEEHISAIAMAKMAFFECSQCNEPYYGGEVECGGDEEEDLDDDVQAVLAMELVCRGCASKGQMQCPEHGTEFLGWKCRYCCEREAHFFCFGTTHFCRICHDLWQTGVEERRKLQAGRPCQGKDRCIFGGRHPQNCRNGRDEYALGCTICAQDTECGLLVNKDKPCKVRRMGLSFLPRCVSGAFCRRKAPLEDGMHPA